MTKDMSFHEEIKAQLRGLLGNTTVDESMQLFNSMRLLAKWRCVLIQNTLIHHHGTIVLGGAFKGLDFLPKSTEGCHIPKLLGCYEQPLRPFIEQAIQTEYSAILNIGCAEGYYAVGMARRMPNTRIMAFDINPAAQSSCLALAKKNTVDDHIEVGAVFQIDDFLTYAGQQVLVLCDIEGAERELIDPQKSPALLGMDIIMESHECLAPGITKEIIGRFKESHQITLVQDSGQRHLDQVPAWFANLSHLDQLLATWEWRNGPTPWLVMKVKDK